tara:strand:+ start:3317 stop:3763 length:447 start_codon:yes stop_codon:yes gene_type:complete
MRWYSKNCFYGKDKIDFCWFDKYSFLHLGDLAFFYSIFLLFGLIKNIKMRWALFLFTIINTLHIIDEIFNIYTNTSLESIWVPKYLGKAQRDSDSVQNFSGDLISGFTGSLIVLLTFYFTLNNKYQPLIVLLTGFFMFCLGIIGWLNG